jgi:hypothetical protein
LKILEKGTFDLAIQSDSVSSVLELDVFSFSRRRCVVRLFLRDADDYRAQKQHAGRRIGLDSDFEFDFDAPDCTPSRLVDFAAQRRCSASYVI